MLTDSGCIIPTLWMHIYMYTIHIYMQCNTVHHNSSKNDPIHPAHCIDFLFGGYLQYLPMYVPTWCRVPTGVWRSAGQAGEELGILHCTLYEYMDILRIHVGNRAALFSNSGVSAMCVLEALEGCISIAYWACFELHYPVYLLYLYSTLLGPLLAVGSFSS